MTIGSTSPKPIVNTRAPRDCAADAAARAPSGSRSRPSVNSTMIACVSGRAFVPNNSAVDIASASAMFVPPTAVIPRIAAAMRARSPVSGCTRRDSLLKLTTPTRSRARSIASRNTSAAARVSVILVPAFIDAERSIARTMSARGAAFGQSPPICNSTVTGCPMRTAAGAARLSPRSRQALPRDAGASGVALASRSHTRIVSALRSTV